LAASTSRIGLAAEAGGAGPRLWLARLTLTDFRNYAQASISLGPESVILSGANGSGKTNILEAVSMLAPGRGLRGAAYADLAKLGGTGGWSIAARLNRDGEEVALGTGQPAPEPDAPAAAGRVVRIDGETAGGSGALGDYVQVLWLTPSMDGLFTGPASERRRFLDRMVASFDDAHRTRLNAFERAMRQRNRLIELGERSERYFAAIEAQMAETGTSIAAGRVEIADRLAGSIALGRSGESAFPWAELALEGWLEAAVRDKAAVEVEDAYAARLADNRERDRASGRTLEGPHRADLRVSHGPKQMPGRLCSTGEQKALLVGLILAHAQALKNAQGGVAPLLLLDEIAAHLDMARREALFGEIDRLGAQAWMTGTDDEVFSPLRASAQFFTVANSSIARNNHDQQRIYARPSKTG
jgi:DNA replication and repair protein RecF